MARLLNRGEAHMTAANLYRDLFRIDISQISGLLFVRVAIAAGTPLLVFLLAGHGSAAVVGGATALLVSLCDIGRTRRERTGTMVLAAMPDFGSPCALRAPARSRFSRLNSSACKISIGQLSR